MKFISIPAIVSDIMALDGQADGRTATRFYKSSFFPKMYGTLKINKLNHSIKKLNNKQHTMNVINALHHPAPTLCVRTRCDRCTNSGSECTLISTCIDSIKFLN